MSSNRYSAFVFVLFVATLSCRDLPTTEEPITDSRPAVSIVSGNRQQGRSGKLLPIPLRVRVRDAHGAPMHDVQVKWTVEEPDVVMPAVSFTNAQGEAETHWIPRAAGAERMAAALIGLREVIFHASVEAAPPAQYDVLTPVTIETYDGSGQVVHPDVVEVEWLGGAPMRMMAVTPYPFGDGMKENPSIYLGGDADGDWFAPPNLENPVALPTAGHLSDPDLVDDPAARELRLYYRQADAANRLVVKTSNDGVTWSDARISLSVPGHQMISPSIVRRSATQWEMWSVNGGTSGCAAVSTKVERRTSSNGFDWSAPQEVQLTAETNSVWHLEVQYLPSLSKYVAVYSVKEQYNCTTSMMFVSTSSDGINWQHTANPLLVRGVIPEFTHIVYRSSFVYDAVRSEFTFWHSGAAYDYALGKWKWRMATERRKANDVFNPSPMMAALLRHAPSPAPPLLRGP